MMFSSAFANYYYNPVFVFISVAGVKSNGASLIHFIPGKHSIHYPYFPVFKIGAILPGHHPSSH